MAFDNLFCRGNQVLWSNAREEEKKTGISHNAKVQTAPPDSKVISLKPGEGTKALSFLFEHNSKTKTSMCHQ
jgi:hypothetical protein